MSDALDETRRKIAEIARLLFDRMLTDAAGGNLSARVGDLVCITPRYSGSKHQWRLRPEQVLVSDLQGKLLDGEGEISREAKVHFRLYHEFPDGQAVVHAHARNALVFASACQPIEPVLEDTLKFGTIRVTRYAPAHSNDLAEFVAEVLRGQEGRVRKQAAAALAPWHGLFVLGKDLDAAFDAAERIDVNARCILMSRLLPGGEQVDPRRIRAELEESVGRYK
jgi:L-fuculose-phosphate aldolase